MLTLALDTTSEHGGVAIYRDFDCLASLANQGPANSYSVTLFHMVDRVLAGARARRALPFLALRDIDLFAVANGPGSFTGIRVGLAAVKAWAIAFGRPVMAISVLEAIVEEARPETEWAVPLLDARRGEFFLGLFRRGPGGSNNHFDALGEGLVLKPSALGTFLEGLGPWELAGGRVTCLVREHDCLAQALRQSLPARLCCQSIQGTLLGAMARLAIRTCQQGKLHTPAELDAYYIRRSDAEVNWRK